MDFRARAHHYIAWYGIHYQFFHGDFPVAVLAHFPSLLTPSLMTWDTLMNGYNPFTDFLAQHPAPLSDFWNFRVAP